MDWLIGLGVPLSRSVLDTLSVIFITLILSYFTLIFGELVPKRIAMKKSEALALGVSGVVSGFPCCSSRSCGCFLFQRTPFSDGSA